MYTDIPTKYRPIVATYGLSLEERVDRRLTKCRSISRPSVGRDVGRVSAEISAECRPIVSVDTRPNVVFNSIG